MKVSIKNSCPLPWFQNTCTLTHSTQTRDWKIFLWINRMLWRKKTTFDILHPIPICSEKGTLSLMHLILFWYK